MDRVHYAHLFTVAFERLCPYTPRVQADGFNPCMALSEWTKLLAKIGWTKNKTRDDNNEDSEKHTISERQAKLAFVWAKLDCSDEFGDRMRYLNCVDFLEALARVAVVLPMPSVQQMKDAGVSNPYDYFGDNDESSEQRPKTTRPTKSNDIDDGPDVDRTKLPPTGYSALHEIDNPIHERVAVMCAYFDEALRRFIFDKHTYNTMHSEVRQRVAIEKAEDLKTEKRAYENDHFHMSAAVAKTRSRTKKKMGRSKTKKM